jgi:vancomycin resistance protein VanJ
LTRIAQHLTQATTRLLRLVVALLITAIVLLTAAQRFGSVGPWWLELSRYMPYPAVLLPAGVALLLSWRLGRTWIVASAATLALVATLTMGLEWHGADRGSERLRVMTYNIKAYKASQRRGGFAELAQEVALQAPDILVMQDANGLLGPPGEAAYPVGPVFGLPEVYAAGQYVVASRFPLRECGRGRVGARGEEVRYVRCVVDVRGRELDLVTVHFESPRNGLNAARNEGLDGVGEWRRNYQERLAQARALARDLRRSWRPMIVAGDLNAPQLSPVIRALLGIGLRDAFASAGRGYGYTYGHALRVGFSFLRIDHILVSPELGVTDCHAGNREASEHRPVIADLLLQRS